MLVRKVGVVAIAAALLLGTAGCSLSSNVATKKVYAASDGNQTDDGHIHARNILVLSDGTNAYIIGSITNDGDTPADAIISVSSGATATPTNFSVPAQGKVDFGYPEQLGFVGSQPGIRLEGTLPAVGTNIEISLNESAAATIAVQVLDGTIPTYKDLMPYLQPSPSATPLETPTATPMATPSATK
jgi:hypothetical protein